MSAFIFVCFLYICSTQHAVPTITARAGYTRLDPWIALDSHLWSFALCTFRGTLTPSPCVFAQPSTGVCYPACIPRVSQVSTVCIPHPKRVRIPCPQESPYPGLVRLQEAAAAHCAYRIEPTPLNGEPKRLHGQPRPFKC